MERRGVKSSAGKDKGEKYGKEILNATRKVLKESKKG